MRAIRETQRWFVAGLSHKTAPVELREQLAVAGARRGCLGCRLKVSGGLNEVVLLSTCNRVEIYGVGSVAQGRIEALFRQLTASSVDVRPYLYVHHGADAVRHLFSVASGLDSMVLGETEITGQVKSAYELARQAKLTGGILNRLFQMALKTAKEVRTRTEIGRGAASVGSVAVELAEKIFSDELTQPTLMIVGAGKMGEACVRHLSKKGVRSVLVANRSFERAQRLSEEFGGRAVPWDQYLTAMADADIVVTSTGSPQTVLDRSSIEALMRARRHRPLFLIDIAVPRDVEPAVQSIENVYLYDIDDLEALVRENVRHREQELARCRAVVEQNTAALMAKLAAVPGKSQEPRVRPEPSWAFCGALAGGS